MKNNRFGLTEGKTAVVTGAGQGIGAAIAEMLGANGAFVIVTDAKNVFGRGFENIAEVR